LTPVRANESVVPRSARGGGEVGTLFVSVILPVRNEARFIERTLAQLVDQDYERDRFEVLVIDGESTDDTPALVARFAAAHPNVRLLSNPRRLSSAARNIAIREARGDVVLLVDGHCDLKNNGSLRELSEAFHRSGADCLGRPQPQDIANPTALQRAIAAARSSRLGHHPDSHVYSATESFVPAKSVAVAYRREVFYTVGPLNNGLDVHGKTVGGFDERFDACEDVEFNHRVDRAGLRCFFTPRIAAHYVPRDTLGGLFRQLFRYGCGRIRLWRKHPETLSMKTLVPGIFVLGCITGFVLAWLSWWLAAACATALTMYIAVVLVGSAAAAVARRDASILPWLPLVFATIHCGAGAGLLWEAVAGSRELRAMSYEQGVGSRA
jgi:succinoglycan biosynthesis protein ExoA